jgi:hypothetical protein
MATMLETWDLWFPQAGATGLPFARSRVNARDAAGGVLVHAAPPVLTVTVRAEDGTIVAEGRDMTHRAEGPIGRLLRDGSTIRLEDHWPDDDDLGRVVILPGGEAGILVSWWHAEDRSEWRWRVEFYNHR